MARKAMPKNQVEKKKKEEEQLTNAQALRILSALTVRATIAARLGKSFSDDRDIYTALGYKKQLEYDDYMAKYKRQDIVRTIIDAPPKACWRQPPQISESDKKETPFEKTWADLVKEKRIFHYLSRVDRLASIGSYAVLLLGFDDGNGLEKEITSAKKLIYLTPYIQSNVAISLYQEDTKSERYGLPEKYSITMKSVGTTAGLSKEVHYSRVIHIAEDCLEDDTEGMPKLQAVYNRLDNLELIVGGSAEMFWRGAFPGYGFKVDEGASLGKQELSDLQDEIEEYMHGLKRYLRLQGISVEDLAQQVADPSNHVSVQLDLISCATGIPKRILLGSERGELASSQDERAWRERIDERRRQYCEPKILRPFIDRLIDVGVLPEPAEEYAVNWPPLLNLGEKESAEVAQIKSKAIKDYADSITAATIVPPDVFYKEIMGFSQEQVDQIKLILEGAIREE